MKHRPVLILIVALALSACLYTARPIPPTVIQTITPKKSATVPAEGDFITPSPEQSEIILPAETSQEPQNLPGNTLNIANNVATIIANPDTSFAFAHIFSLAYLEDGQLLVTVDVPGGVSGQFFARLGPDLFNCQTLDAHPNRLFCNGETTQAGLIVPFMIFTQGETEARFETDLGIPPFSMELGQKARLSGTASGEGSP